MCSKNGKKYFMKLEVVTWRKKNRSVYDANYKLFNSNFVKFEANDPIQAKFLNSNVRIKILLKKAKRIN